MIYKEKGDIRNLKNWRPITLLNTDYKIMTKTIANRIRQVAGNIVHLDQGCGIENRTIHDQLFFIRDFIHYYKECNKTAFILAIDQEKAFDRVDHIFILKILEKFNFGPTILSLVKSIYTKMSSCLLINGHITKQFTVSRSVRQGDGLSMILYVLVGELLSEMIRKNQEITPVILPNTKPKKLSQYADDISILTENKKCLPNIWRTIEKYQKLTGAKINQEKTEILLVGTWSKKQKGNLPEMFKKCVKEN